MTKEEMEQLFDVIEAEAVKREKEAAYNGRMSDGGAGILRRELMFFQFGLEGKIPTEWERYVQEVNKLNNSEYKLYLSLKEWDAYSTEGEADKRNNPRYQVYEELKAKFEPEGF
jgi:hypothetical protein